MREASPTAQHDRRGRGRARCVNVVWFDLGLLLGGTPPPLWELAIKPRRAGGVRRQVRSMPRSF